MSAANLSSQFDVWRRFKGKSQQLKTHTARSIEKCGYGGVVNPCIMAYNDGLFPIEHQESAAIYLYAPSGSDCLLTFIVPPPPPFALYWSSVKQDPPKVKYL